MKSQDSRPKTQDSSSRSSDDDRSAAPLPHARVFGLPGPLTLEFGGRVLPEVEIAFETYGRLNASADNAILICHALSGDSHVARHDPDDTPGWWDVVVGPGLAIDTDRYFVICVNVLGGCRGTTGPNRVDPATGRPYGAEFPRITVGDIVETQRQLVTHLGIKKLHAVVGGSLGGHQALTWGIRHPDAMRGVIALATSPRLNAQALAFDIVGRNAIVRDPDFRDGQYYDHPTGPRVGLALARMLGHITYLSREAMTEKFDLTRMKPREIDTGFEKHYGVGTYLAHQGDKFVERFDANSYIALSRAMDDFDLGATPDDLRAAFAQTKARWLVMSFTSDWLFPPFQGLQIAEALAANNKAVSYCDVKSQCGHDAFLLPDNLAVYGEMIRGFLDHLDGHHDQPGPATRGGQPSRPDPRSIFHAQRLDHDLILDLIPPQPQISVLDVGCGGGELLALLKARGHRRLMGVELDEQAIITCVARGLDVVQADLNQPLTAFSDQQFDVVLLSQTLQSITDTERIVSEIVRIGKRAIVSFPNFAYKHLREMLYKEGRSPKSTGIFTHEWYNTPNRRFPSIADVRDFCRDKGLTIHRQVYLESGSGQQVVDDPNLNADIAIFVLSRSK